MIASTRPLRRDLLPAVARFAEQTRSLLAELAHAQARVRGWSDGQRPGFFARCLGYRDDDDFRPTIELFGELARWLQHASEFVQSDGQEAPHVQHAAASVRSLVLAEDELAARVSGMLAAIRGLDARFSATHSSPYRDVHIPDPSATVTSSTDAGDGDEESSRARLLARYEPVFRRVASRYAVDDSGRDDLSQEIRLAVWLALPKYRGDASIGTYVRRIAHYCGARFGRRPQMAPLLDEPADEGPDLLEQLDDAQRRTAMREALSTLPDRQRAALELLLCGSSYREIASRLGISESNASVRITRARKQLRRQLAPRYA